MPVLSTADGERLHAVVLPGPPRRWLVLAHGSGSTAVPGWAVLPVPPRDCVAP